VVSGTDVGITRMLLPEASEAREFFEARQRAVMVDGGWWMAGATKKPPQKFGQSSNGKRATWIFGG